MQIHRKKYQTVLLVSSLIIGLDQLTKYIVCKLLPLHSRIEVFRDFLNIVHIRNPGIAFGLLKQFGSQFKVLCLILVSAVVLFLLVFLITQIKKEHRLQTFSLSLILGGAIGNLIDRFRLGEVIDFIDVHWRSIYHWPAFNVADSAITVGIIIIVLCELLKHKQEKVPKMPKV